MSLTRIRKIASSFVLGGFLFMTAAPVLASGGEGPAPINWIDMGYADKDPHGGELEPNEHPMAPPLALALLNFGILVALLVWKAGPIARKHYRQKHENIRDALEEAGRLRKAAEDKLAEYGDKIKNVDAEVQALIDDIRNEAESEREHILATAKAQAEALRKDAEQRIEAELQIARRGLEREVTDAAIKAATEILREKVTVDDQKGLVDGFIRSLKSGPEAQERA